MAQALRQPTRSWGTERVWDLPLLRLIRLNWDVAIFVVILLVTIGTRFWDLGSRAQHHDESMHAFYSYNLSKGLGFEHTPLLHGPLWFHLVAFSYFLFGASDYTSRLMSAIFGVLLVLSPLLLRKYLGRRGTLATAGMLAISPAMMYYSRFVREDIFATVFTVMAFIGIMRYLDERRDRWLYLMVVGWASVFATKEVAFIHAFVFGVFLFGLLGWFVVKKHLTLADLQKTAAWDLVIMMGTLLLPLTAAFIMHVVGWNPLDYTYSGILRSSSILVPLLGISIAVGLWWDQRRWLGLAAVYYAIYLLAHTTLLTNPQGIFSGLVGALGYWLSQQDVRRGDQPPYYYIILQSLYEFLPVLLGLIAVVMYAIFPNWRKRVDGDTGNPEQEQLVDPSLTRAELNSFFGIFLIYWWILAFIIYSWAGEKMPWLLVEITVPTIYLAGRFLGQLLEATDFRLIRERGGAIFALLVPALFIVLWALLDNNGTVGNQSISALNQTMRFVSTLILFLGLAYLAVKYFIQLGWFQASRTAFLTLIVALAIMTIRYAVMASFVHGDIAKEMLIYTQTTPDVTMVVKEIDQISMRVAGGKNLNIAYDNESSWPFEWYLRDYPKREFKGGNPGATLTNPVILVGTVNENAFKPYINSSLYVQYRYRLRWWFPQDYMDMTIPKAIQLLQVPENRAKLWNLIFYRQVAEPLGSTDFYMYIRKDVVNDIWQMRAEAVAAEPTLLDDTYTKRYKEIGAQASFGAPGTAPSQFQNPKDIKIAPDGNLYVADSSNGRVQILDPQGKFISAFGSLGQAPEQLSEFWGLAVAPDKTVYIA
ncbi:MAG: TIGR03663 family protein, partial [Chloroflexi bacterium]|nr:TIGR03663 family protein [Chloroflexota bacterium]